MGFNDFGGGFGGPDPFNKPSRRDMLEIDSGGKTTAEHKKQRQEEQQKKYEEMQYGNNGYNSNNTYGSQRGMGSKLNPKNWGKKNQYGNGSYGNQSEGSWLSFAFGLALVAGLIYMVVSSMNGGLTGVFRGFNASPTENATIFKNSFQDLAQKSNDFGKEVPDVYTKNRVYDATMLEQLPYPEYLVYVYTGTELDTPFNDYLSYQEDNGTLAAPVYRIEQELIKDYKLRNIIKEEVPMLVIYTEDADGVKTYDSVITDPVHFEQLNTYIKGLQEINDENQRNRIGVYGDSEGFTDLKKYFE